MVLQLKDAISSVGQVLTGVKYYFFFGLQEANLIGLSQIFFFGTNGDAQK
jgi:hypothetical protein